jgi:hypothetical protein
VSGSNGLAACADTTLILNRDGQGTTLYGRGRDIEEFEKALQFDRTSGAWTILGEADEVRRSDERTAILTALEAAPGPLTPSQIVAATNMKRANVDFLLSRMGADGEVLKLKRGLYTSAQNPRNAKIEEET